MRNKKGVSVMVSYVLLIVIAVALSTILYSFLNLHTPKDKVECTGGINIIIEDVEYCEAGQLKLTLQNRGRFKINAAYIRLGEQGSEFREWINDPENGAAHADFYFIGPSNSPGLLPGNSQDLNPLSIDSIVTANAEYILEVQPAIFTQRESQEDLALCTPITQIITCST